MLKNLKIGMGIVESNCKSKQKLVL